MSYRTLARIALANAKEELSSGDDRRLRYAALELRMAMESLTYSQAEALKEEIPPSEYETWQPRRLMQVLLDIDPHADHKVTIRAGLEKEYGVPSSEMHTLGETIPLSLATIKQHYDALGSYLHVPTASQMAGRREKENIAKLRDRCERLIIQIEETLAAKIINSSFGVFGQLECAKCGKVLRSRLRKDRASEVTCSCGAEYKVEDAGEGKSIWHTLQHEVFCPSQECDGRVIVWKSEIRKGAFWQCPVCKGTFHLGLRVIAGAAPEA